MKEKKKGGQGLSKTFLVERKRQNLVGVPVLMDSERVRRGNLVVQTKPLSDHAVHITSHHIVTQGAEREPGKLVWVFKSEGNKNQDLNKNGLVGTERERKHPLLLLLELKVLDFVHNQLGVADSSNDVSL